MLTTTLRISPWSQSFITVYYALTFYELFIFCVNNTLYWMGITYQTHKTTLFCTTPTTVLMLASIQQVRSI